MGLATITTLIAVVLICAIGIYCLFHLDKVELSVLVFYWLERLAVVIGLYVVIWIILGCMFDDWINIWEI